MMTRDEETAAVLLAFAERDFPDGRANLAGYGLIDGRGGRLVICLNASEYEGEEGFLPGDASALTRSREAALLWLIEEPIALRMRDAVGAYRRAEKTAGATGDLTPALEAADVVIALAEEWTAPPKELPVFEVDLGDEPDFTAHGSFVRCDLCGELTPLGWPCGCIGYEDTEASE